MARGDRTVARFRLSSMGWWALSRRRWRHGWRTGSPRGNRCLPDDRCGGTMQLASALRVTHVMVMSNEEILFPRSARSARVADAAFRGPEPHGPVIDQDGREIPAETLGARF